MSVQKELFQEKLLSWYHAGHRILPWREDPTAYHVWVSEIMLQQTRVEAVKGYYQRFMEALPTVYDLKEISDEKLLKLWEGLGYYSRARNLKKAAGMIVDVYQGKIPDTYEELIKLPGIGDYTAGAILSIAYHKPYPALDGNVFRVLTRVYENPVDILSNQGKQEIRSLLLSLLSKEDPSSFTQALMELGALVCVPNGTPHCDVCPLSSFCKAHLHQRECLFPVKKKKTKRRVEKRYVFLITYQNRVLLNQREETGLLAHFYEFPNILVDEETKTVETWLRSLSLEMKEVTPLGEAKHLFTHVEWQMMGYHIELKKPIAGIWASREELEEVYPIPSAFMKYQEQLKQWIK